MFERYRIISQRPSASAQRGHRRNEPPRPAHNLASALAIGLGLLALSPGVAIAATVNASSCSFSAVSSAVSSAAPGDTVVIPAGTCSWTGTLAISKGLTLAGAGSGATRLSASGGVSPLIELSPSSDVPVRIHDLGFSLGSESPWSANTRAIYVSSSVKLTKVRIDHNTFKNGNGAILLYRQIYGVIDHNQFLNAQTPIYLAGDDNAAWLRPIAAGTADAMFVEDNTFTINNDTITDTYDSQVYLQQAASVVVRHNTFDTLALTKQMNFISLNLNNHGNQNYYTGSSDFRGSPIFEFYNNISNTYHVWSFIGIRGGSSLIHHNTFTAVTGSPTLIELTEEESWQTAFFNPLRTTWPAEDQIMNTFIWSNTYNGQPIAEISLDEPQDGPFIQKNRDYFMHEPQSTGGKEVYSGRAGGPMTFSSAGANAYYPYTPYMYPHPLTGAPTAQVLKPPTGLRVVAP
jgi:hypothetical protein